MFHLNLFKNKTFLTMKKFRLSQIDRFLSTKTEKQVYISTPIFYVNAAPHIGHLYTSLIADSLTRWQKIKGKSVVFSTGTDEHGLKVQEAADNAGKKYKQFCDEVSETFKEAFDECDIQYTDFIRTTDPRHEESVHKIWMELFDKGHIYLGEHKAWYSKADETFLTEMQVKEVVDVEQNCRKMVSLESGHPVEMVCEENYKFRLSAFQKPLLEWLDNNPEVIYPKSRYNEVRATITQGLSDISVSRLKENVKWAIDTPNDESHAVYVWLDALTNYLTCSGYPGEHDHTWPADYHIIGKDILKFHAIYWPAFLLAAGVKLPKRIVAHAHWTVGKVKMSKSLGNVIKPSELISNYGVDPVRYFLLSEGGMKNDGDFSIDLFQSKVNNDLADNLGNLVSRCTSPSLLNGDSIPPCGLLSNDDLAYISILKDLPKKVEVAFDKPNVAEGIIAIMTSLNVANKYFFDNAPWKLAKQLRENSTLSSDELNEQRCRLNTILYVTIEGIRISGILLQPVVPNLAGRVLDMIGVKLSERKLEDAAFSTTTNGLLGETVPGGVFSKIKVKS